MALAAASAGSSQAAADQVALRPRFQAGDRYAVTLSLDTKTRVDARETFRESVQLRYAARVEVLETDSAGLPRRERHEEVELTSVRPDGTRELFAKGTAIELERHGDGSVAIEFQGERVEARIEKVVADLLAHQTEYALAALLDPGRPVAAGERWELDPARVVEFLRARGVGDVELDGVASAALQDDGLAVRYRIPIREFELPELPDGARSTHSKGRLEGEVKLGSSGLHRAQAHRSQLVLDIDGTLAAAGGAHAAPWRLHRSQAVDQHTETLKDQLASGLSGES